jgi:pimeloyl-ACP methyl ester carboxylesterase
MKKYWLIIFLAVIIVLSGVFVLLRQLASTKNVDLVSDDTAAVGKLYENDILTSDNVRLHFWFYNEGTSTVTVFFHGGVCGDSSQFRAMGAEVYRKQFGSLLIFDERGCGKSQLDVPAESINAARLALDVDELRAIVIPNKPIVLLGRSYGGVLATLYATSKPKNVVGVVLVAPGYFDAATSIAGGALIDPVVNARILQAEHDYLIEHYNNFVVADDSVTGGMTDSYFSNLAVTTVNHIEWLASLSDIPTLIITGEFDTRVPQLAVQEMKKVLPSAIYVEIANSGHYGQYTHEEEFLAAVQEWWIK